LTQAVSVHAASPAVGGCSDDEFEDAREMRMRDGDTVVHMIPAAGYYGTALIPATPSMEQSSASQERYRRDHNNQGA
jgi:hypothetical protein